MSMVHEEKCKYEDRCVSLTEKCLYILNKKICAAPNIGPVDLSKHRYLLLCLNEITPLAIYAIN